MCMQEYYTLIRKCQQAYLAALQAGDAELQQQCQKYMQQWQATLDNLVDAQTASILQVYSEQQHLQCDVRQNDAT